MDDGVLCELRLSHPAAFRRNEIRRRNIVEYGTAVEKTGPETGENAKIPSFRLFLFSPKVNFGL